MNTSRLTAILAGLAVQACWPTESFPPQEDAGAPMPDAAETCKGLCVPVSPAGWSEAALVWVGNEADAPPCPADAVSEFYTGHGYRDGPIPCSACTCDKPTGSCALPATLTAAAASCADDGSGVAHTSFDPPASWDGFCSGEIAIPAGKLCGGVPCVQSVTIAPLKPSGCLPNGNTNASPPPWDTFVRVCLDTPYPLRCTTNSGVCVTVPPGPEFKQCIIQRGYPPVLPCPPNYPDKRIFYDGAAPYCAPCACRAPTGNTCAGSIALFEDGVCGSALGAAVSLDASGPTCIDVPPGSALGSKIASDPIFKPGSCTPTGGAPEGMMICCQPGQ
jgi:hypothetical protein